jgi:hypothetical protein
VHRLTEVMARVGIQFELTHPYAPMSNGPQNVLQNVPPAPSWGVSGPSWLTAASLTVMSALGEEDASLETPWVI